MKMRINDIKETRHEYKEYTILGTSYVTEGGWVLGGRHYAEGGLKRNYQIKKGAFFVINLNCRIETLKEAKKMIDNKISTGKFFTA